MSDIEPWQIPRTMAERAVEEWAHLEIRCIVTPVLGRCTFNGYVQIPEELRETWNALKLVGPYLHIPGDEPYGPDREGWLGFSTTGGNDVWGEDELTGFFTSAQIAEHERDLKNREEFQGELDKAFPVPGIETRLRSYHTWTRTELHQRVNDLARQVAVRRAMARIGLSQNKPLQHRLAEVLKSHAEKSVRIEADRERSREEGEGYFSLLLLQQQEAADALFEVQVLKIEAVLTREK